MDPDYRDAARRHHQDAKDLLDRHRFANADHLFGLAAECAIKEVMVILGAKTSPDGGLAQHRVHINKLWQEYLTFPKGRTGTKLITPLECLPADPFSDWDVDQRYAPQQRFVLNIVMPHRKAAEACQVVLQRADAFRSTI